MYDGSSTWMLNASECESLTRTSIDNKKMEEQAQDDGQINAEQVHMGRIPKTTTNLLPEEALR